MFLVLPIQQSDHVTGGMATHDGTRQPVNGRTEMAAHPPRAQLGSEPRQKVTSPSGIAHDQVLALCAYKL